VSATVYVCAFEAVRGLVARFQHAVCAIAGEKCLKSQCHSIFTITVHYQTDFSDFVVAPFSLQSLSSTFCITRARARGARRVQAARAQTTPHPALLLVRSDFLCLSLTAPGFTPLAMSRRPPNLRVVHTPDGTRRSRCVARRTSLRVGVHLRLRTKALQESLAGE
jgi:hypothetical protein